MRSASILNMKTLTIKNVPEELYNNLAESARRNRRSLNNEAIVQLEKATEAVETRERLERIRRFRESLPKDVWVTDEIIAESRAELVRREDQIIRNASPLKKKALKSKVR